MEVGVWFDSNDVYTGQYATVDAFTLYKIRETAVGTIAVQNAKTDGVYNGKVTLSINAKAGGEALLKISYANYAPVYTDVKLTVNGKAGGTAALSATGVEPAGFTPCDATYIPVWLSAGENTVVLTFAERELILKSFALVDYQTKW